MSIQESSALVTDNKAYLFKPGCAPGPGRPKGSRNKISEDFVAALQEDFNAINPDTGKRNGVHAIEQVRLFDPGKYLDIITKIMPRDFVPATQQLSDMTDEEIEQYLIELRSAVVEHARTRATADSGANQETEQAPVRK